MPHPPGSGLPNEHSYTELSETVVDDITCLEWQKVAPDEGYAWLDAVEYCEDLELAGYDDWRLPTRIEMISLFQFEQGVDAALFEGEPGHTWTSSRTAASIDRGEEGSAWVLYGLGVYTQLVTTPRRLRCVRRGGAGEEIAELAVAPPNQYTEISSGEVRDNYTGLIWQQRDSRERMPYAEAAGYCSTLELGGNAWRLPSAQELSTLVDEADWGLSINVDVFPDTQYDLEEWYPYWAAALLDDDSGRYRGHAVQFLGGGVESLSVAGKGDPTEGWVKCVR